ncbi:MAG: Stp1/IreP family PP2C-type Ser/Thr phosphatase [Deltaproteobacteria bacterium]|nr:Stp1/IreP family PP2C-type Ser/Thr phosphatase [Deltaproteobacteria bacterium]
MSSDRPSHFAPGTPLGDRYTVEGLVRLAEGRMFYLVNDDRPDQPHRICQDCGKEDVPQEAKACPTCGAPIARRRFLLSSRWTPDTFEAYEQWAARKLQHPGLTSPLSVFRHEGQLLSVTPYAGEGLMLDEASPLSNARVLNLAQKLAGTLAFLHLHGIRLSEISRRNLLISQDNVVTLFDLDVAEVLDGPVPEAQRADEVAAVAALLARYANVAAGELLAFMGQAAAGQWPAPATFGRAVEERYDRFSECTWTEHLGGISDVGLVRQLNEDNWGWRKLSDRATLYVVADGMGGHDAGEVASALAVSTILSQAAEQEAAGLGGPEKDEKLLGDAFVAANNHIKRSAEAKGSDMGTTMVCVMLVGDNLGYFGNVGDSRAYLIRKRTLHQVSKDHSLVAKMVERGRLTAEEARHHPHSNILLRTVGTELDVDVDIFRVEFQSGDRVLMCSDGLWGEVEDKDIENILNTYEDPRIAARELVRAAHQGGGKDNVTVMVVGIP